VILKIKAFIYRLSSVFGLRIYLAEKEENGYINSIEIHSNIQESVARGMWQAQHGFTTVWTWGQPWYRALSTRIRHAFDFRSLDNSARVKRAFDFRSLND
jgi:hypothetical protein